MEKEYKITFTADYTLYEKWAQEGKGSYWKEEIKNNPEQLTMCKKWHGKTIKLSELPDFIKEVGQVVVSDDSVEVYNDYRE